MTTAAEASSAATRLLELATRNADEVVAEAREDAEKILGEARAEAQKLESETKSRTDKLEQDARTPRRRTSTPRPRTSVAELLGDMEKEKGRLDSEIENLRAFEREYRSRLKSYFTQQLKALDGSGEGGDLPTPDDEPKDGPRDREQAADQSQGS